jgi:precorrin-6A/cobalt-precorrin-6A reductase
MILLIGGTAETAQFAVELTEAGFPVLISKATNIFLRLPDHPLLTLRTGKLSRRELEDLIKERRIGMVVDASHPYASEIRANASKAAHACGVPYCTYIRPPALESDKSVTFADDHDRAADIAFALGKPLLLTTGSRNLRPYADRARTTGIPLWARVPPHEESIQACLDAGIDRSRIITERGPFSVIQNIRHIKESSVGTLVSKDGGALGGTLEKKKACLKTGCGMIVVKRPAYRDVTACGSVPEVLEHVNRVIGSQHVAEPRP